MGMMKDSHPHHHFYQMFSSPEDLGYAGLARYRTWTIGMHEDRSTCIFDPFQLYDEVKKECSKRYQTQIKDYLVASTEEVTMEAADLALRRKIPFRAHLPQDLDYLLTIRERSCIASLNQQFRQRFNKDPLLEENLVYHLGDNADYCSWSAVSNKIPTFRVGSKSSLYWLPKHGRWLTAKERLVSMGWPVIHEVAAHQGLPVFGAKDTKRASDLVGNAMHWQTAGVFQLIALCCFGPSGSDR